MSMSDLTSIAVQTCVCVCVLSAVCDDRAESFRKKKRATESYLQSRISCYSHTHTHTHTQIACGQHSVEKRNSEDADTQGQGEIHTSPRVWCELDKNIYITTSSEIFHICAKHVA